MALSGIERHHHAIRIDPKRVEESRVFYSDVLGLGPDPDRPNFPAAPGFWMDCDNDVQIHLIGVEGDSALAKEPDKDPAAPHVALGVPIIETAKRELEVNGLDYWTNGPPEAEQVFIRDPNGNLIELHEIGRCRCVRSTR